MNKFLTVLMICFIMAGCFFVYDGFDKKDNYYSSDIYYTLSKNAYVGGDAYNYIINANYFTGYMILAGIMWFLSGICAIGIGLINISINQFSIYEKYVKLMKAVNHHDS